MTLTREDILAARRSRKPHLLEVPEWGGEVYLKVLSAEEQAELQAFVDDHKTDTRERLTITARIVAAAVVNEDGVRLFSDDDVPELMREDAPVLMRVYMEAAKLNGLTTEELEEAMRRFAPAPDEQRVTA